MNNAPLGKNSQRAAPVTAAVLAVIVTIAVTACGHPTASRSAGATTPASTQPTPPSRPSTPVGATSPAPSAADQIAGFVAAAERADTQIRHAAVLINGGIGRTSMRFPRSTLDAIHAIDITAAARAIPAGLPQDLLRDAMTVYGDLDSRTAALHGVMLYDGSGSTLPIGGQDAKGVLRCLRHGAPAAGRFGADLAAMLALARVTPPVTLASPQSRAAAEVAVRITMISRHNFCSYECGGYAPTQLTPLTWNPATRPGHYDGTTGAGGRFWADYHPGQGWQADINAC